MQLSEFKEPVRVWINAPSRLQPPHSMHGARGIAMIDQHCSDTVRIYFCTGDIISMQVNPLYLSRCADYGPTFSDGA